MNKLKTIRPVTRKNLITYLITMGFFAVSAVLVSTGAVGSLFRGLLIPIGYYIIAAVSLNLTVGVLGELSLGHAGFMCVGAYVGGVFALLAQDAIPSAGLRYAIALILGGLVAALFGVIIGIPILRLRGDYLAIVTLAFGEIIRKVIQNFYLTKDVNGLHFSFAKAVDITTVDAASSTKILNGPMAMSGIPKTATLLTTALLVLVTLIVISNLVDSRSGRAFMAIRDNRIAAESLGINVTKYKMIVFVVSAFFAGIAGVIYAHCNIVDSTKFDYNMSILILVFVVLGGIGSIRGSVIAAILLYSLPELLRGFQAYRMLLYAITLIVMMLINNNAHLKELRARFFGRKNKKEVEA